MGRLQYPQTIVIAFASAFLLSSEAACINPGESEHTMDGKPASEVFAASRAGALAKAACEGRRDRIAVELKAGIDPNARGLWGLTPLVWALHCKNTAGVGDLLAAGADANVRISEIPVNPTAVVLAAGMENPTLLRLLLDHGGDPNAVELKGDETALTKAVFVGVNSGNWENYYALIKAGADINKVHADDTVAETALSFNQFDKISELLDLGYRVRLNEIAHFVSRRELSEMEGEQLEWAKKVRRQLELRGVDFSREEG